MAEKEKKISKSSESAKDIQTTQTNRVLSPFDEMDRWFGNIFPRDWMKSFHRDWPSWGDLSAPLEGRLPKVDVIDRDNEVIVRAEVPGVEKDDLDVSISDSTVTIKGKTKHEEKEEKGDYYQREISSAAFVRRVMLPHNVDTKGSKAKFKDGVLKLTLPKVEKAKRHTIKID